MASVVNKEDGKRDQHKLAITGLDNLAVNCMYVCVCI